MTENEPSERCLVSGARHWNVCGAGSACAPMTSVDDDAVPAVEAEMSHLVVTCVQCGQVVPEATDEEVAAFRASIVPATETVETQDGEHTRTIEEARIELYESLPHPFSCGGREQPKTYYAETCSCYARDVVETFEAAIRAPLEERIEQLEQLQQPWVDNATMGIAWRARAEAAEERIRELEAALDLETNAGRASAYRARIYSDENAKLREALTKVARRVAEPSASGIPPLIAIEAIVTEALATSSTEATDEVEG